MAGVGNLPIDTSPRADVEDSVVGRFIDKLDHLQYRVLTPLSLSISKIDEHIAEHGSAVFDLQKVTPMHADMLRALEDHEERLTQLAGTVSRLRQQTQVAVASHRGPGTLPPASSSNAPAPTAQAGLNNYNKLKPAR